MEASCIRNTYFIFVIWWKSKVGGEKKRKLNVVINLSKEVPVLLNKTILLLLIQRKKMNKIKREITFKSYQQMAGI